MWLHKSLLYYMIVEKFENTEEDKEEGKEVE